MIFLKQSKKKSTLNYSDEMAKITIKAIVQTIFDKKRQNQLYEHQFIRIEEIGTKNIFDIQFYNEKIKVLEGAGVKEKDEVLIEINLNGKFWEKDGREGIFLKLNGQKIIKL